MAMTQFNRRQFLTLGLAGLAALAFSLGATRAKAQSIFGEAWVTAAQLQTKLGPAFSVRNLQRHEHWWYADVIFQGASLHLKSSDGQAWYTADWQHPTAA